LSRDLFTSALAEHVWKSKYRFVDAGEIHDQTLRDTWQRVARTLATVDAEDKDEWQQRFMAVLEGFRFLPGGRIQAGAGTGRRVTLFNCFVMGYIEDSMDSIFDNLKEGAITMQQGGGVGYDFSTLRPKGSMAHATGRIASGPVSFMHIWDATCATVLSTGARRGAMMASLRCDHPDIEAFIQAKREHSVLRHFNLSVQATDAFMEAVEQDADWPLVFPADDAEATSPEEMVTRTWPGRREPVPCRVYRRVQARELWSKIMRATYDYAEPGVLFVDQVNRLNNLWYCEHLSTTNPCGEIPLPPYGACDLGSINLTAFVREPFTASADFDWDGMEQAVQVAVRMLDNTIDASRFPLKKQEDQVRAVRRIGLGLTGLADALIMQGIHYGSPHAREVAAKAMKSICHTAYRTSVELAREKGSFPAFDRDRYLEGAFIRSLPDDIRDAIAHHGIRNSHLTAIAPTGTISLLANNISSGIEPVFDFYHTRRLLDLDGSYRIFEVEDYAHALWRQQGRDTADLPEAFVNARALTPLDHLAMQATLQPYVDSAISKTINVPEDYPLEEFLSLYEVANKQGLKGCTTFRPNPVTGEILSSREGEEEGVGSAHCCSIERETD
jgi:ribonucleoside-diphosphate reductase alpha chain